MSWPDCGRNKILFMSTDNGTPIESLETWLSGKPYWEQYIWKINFEKDILTEEDIDQCCQYLYEHLGLTETIPNKPTISFKGEFVNNQEAVGSAPKIKILEIKDIENVNALTESCSVKFGTNLTIIYGGNGSGKSGIGRLLCNACFSRGDREILPNIRTANGTDRDVKATFVTDDGAGNKTEIRYSLDHNNDELKRFSVFDSASVLIHLDQTNHVNFTPAQIVIFDKVALTISKLEERVTNEKSKKRKNDPFQTMFLGEIISTTSTFCGGITGATKEADFLRHANFNSEVDEVTMATLQRQINEKMKLDIPKKKTQLVTDRSNLIAFKDSLQKVVDRFTKTKRDEINQLIKDILEKRKLVQDLSVKSFENVVLNTTGSVEWKALISAAQTLYKTEKVSNEGKELEGCMLCHQDLSDEAKTLFQKYWLFLESKAEIELSALIARQTLFLRDLRLIKVQYPKFLDTDAGVKVLGEDDPTYLLQLKEQFVLTESVLDDWMVKVEKFEAINESAPVVDLTKISMLIATKITEEDKLVDPTAEIKILTAKWNELKHKKDMTAVKGEGLEYLTFLSWLSKINNVTFPSIKMATTKKRTESFLIGVAKKYKEVFNTELAQLGCDFNLVMNTSGDQGTTVKEYRLDFAEDYNPSQILSEGEQKVCSLADFLTEVQLDRNNCGIIFDDPVTSLDHDRKDKIARRLAIEATRRQVVIFTHDIVFIGQLIRHAEKERVTVDAHWMRQVNGVPGHVEDNATPKTATLLSLKNNIQESMKDFASLGIKEQERALGISYDYLRSACEAVVEELLFAGTVRRYDDHVRMQNLEEATFDQPIALKVVDLHGRISEKIPAHNRSDLQRENPLSLDDFTTLRKEFGVLEEEIRVYKKTARDDRKKREAGEVQAHAGW